MGRQPKTRILVPWRGRKYHPSQENWTQKVLTKFGQTILLDYWFCWRMEGIRIIKYTIWPRRPKRRPKIKYYNICRIHISSIYLDTVPSLGKYLRSNISGSPTHCKQGLSYNYSQAKVCQLERLKIYQMILCGERHAEIPLNVGDQWPTGFQVWYPDDRSFCRADTENHIK